MGPFRRISSTLEIYIYVYTKNIYKYSKDYRPRVANQSTALEFSVKTIFQLPPPPEAAAVERGASIVSSLGTKEGFGGSKEAQYPGYTGI